MILTFHARYLSYFSFLLYPPVKSAGEEILNEIYSYNLFKKCISRHIFLLMILSSVRVN